MAVRGQPSWRDRLNVPNYRVGEAALYAELASQTVTAWQSASHAHAPLRSREARAQLSYFDLIELAVVGKFRKAGITLKHISQVRDYMSREFTADHPFATYRFKTDGKELIVDLGETAAEKNGGVSLWPARKGQLSWNAIIDPLLRDFDYEEDLALRWHIKGRSSPILIDPSISFGAPAVRGIPTAILRERYVAKENPADTAEDFGLTVGAVEEALRFERVLFDQHTKLN